MYQTIPYNILNNSWIQNVCSIIIVSIFVFALSPENILTLFIILGQAHFALTYLYQRRAGKLTNRSIIVQVLLLGLLFLIATPVLYPWFLIVAGTLFCIHYFQDEIKMFGETPSAALFLSGSAFTAAYAGFLATAAFPKIEILPHALALGVLLLISSFFIALYKGEKSTALHFYFGALYVGFFILFMSKLSVPVESLLGSIILLHYVRWYIHYYWQLDNNKPKQRQYIQTSIFVNILILTLYLASTTFSFLDPIYTYFFTPLFFFSWTILHILFSVRKNDYAFISSAFHKR